MFLSVDDASIIPLHLGVMSTEAGGLLYYKPPFASLHYLTPNITVIIV